MKEKRNLLIGIILAALIALIFLFVVLIYQQNALLKSHEDYQNAHIAQQSELIESTRKSGLVCLMSNVLDKVDDELKQNPKRTLSDETIARIAALSHSFEPNGYMYLENDSLSVRKSSLERGHLLLIFSHMGIDSSSFDKIKFRTTFAGADLRGAGLKGTNLRGADLMCTNLRGADLSEAILKEADLRGADLWGVNLSNADLRGTALNRADLAWADLNGADLRGADLRGADLRSAKLKKADLREAKLKVSDLRSVKLKNADLSKSDVTFADLRGAFLNEANLTDVALFGTDLRRADLSQADLSQADLRKTNLSETNLSNANLSAVRLDRAGVQEENWLSQLNVWQVTGAQEIQERYKIVDDISGQTKYILEKIED